ncbi:MAG: phosphomannomutase/phosphoglucomutase [Propionibacteriaceae bacterium]|nr:phosphomannomutase/phosphoglucomutase [Propionibacteriaceae bacterium]
MLKSQIFKANDIRGIVGTEWDMAGAYSLGCAFALLIPQKKIVVSRDMRVSSPEILSSFLCGVVDTGTSVVDLGLASTDELWFASGLMDLPGVQITSSHNTSIYNGLKMCMPGAKPVTPLFLKELAHLAQAIDSGEHHVTKVANPASVHHHDIGESYADYLLKHVNMTGKRHMKVVIDAGNGMGGLSSRAVLSKLDIELVGLFMDLDGTFPNHQPNPLEPQNLVDAQQAVVAHGADLALVFDGDADRVFVIDERGQVVSPSVITAMISVRLLDKEPGATVIVNTTISEAVHEIIKEHGGTVIESRVGHTYIKALMAESNAIFGGEHSAHYYFRDFFGADTGMLAALHVLAEVGKTDKPLSEIVDSYSRYEASGEINMTVHEPERAIIKVAEAFGRNAEVHTNDGLKIRGDQWCLCVRSSNTEPLVRLNVEARSSELMAKLRDEVLFLLKEE